MLNYQGVHFLPFYKNKQIHSSQLEKIITSPKPQTPISRIMIESLGPSRKIAMTSDYNWLQPSSYVKIAIENGH